MWYGTVEQWFWYWLGGLHWARISAASAQNYGAVHRLDGAVEELERMRVAALLQSFDPVISVGLGA